MVFRKQNSTAGFSLIEVLVAITILGLVVVPIGSSLVLSFRLNARSEQMLQAQLAVSSAVETIMAEGYDPDTNYTERFGVTISNIEPETRIITVDVSTAPEDENGVAPVDESEDGVETEEIVIYYELTVSDEDGLISVDTCVRPAPTEEEGGDA